MNLYDFWAQLDASAIRRECPVKHFPIVFLWKNRPRTPLAFSLWKIRFGATIGIFRMKNKVWSTFLTKGTEVFLFRVRSNRETAIKKNTEHQENQRTTPRIPNNNKNTRTIIAATKHNIFLKLHFFQIPHHDDYTQEASAFFGDTNSLRRPHRQVRTSTWIHMISWSFWASLSSSPKPISV